MRALTITAAALLIAALNQTELAPNIKPTAPAVASQSPTARAQTEPSVRTLVKRAARAKGWTAAEWDCLDRLIWRESSWRPHARNPESSAYGLFQILKLKPGTPIRKQIERGIRYIAHRYSSPCAALQHSLDRGWY